MQISSSYNSYDYYSSKPSFDKTNQSDSTQKDEKNLSENKDDKEKNGEQTQMVNGVELSQKEVAQVRELQSIDRNVKAHEAAHQAAGGGLAGAASFTYTRGPDNQMYATAGEVPISMQKGNTPEETIANARQSQQQLWLLLILAHKTIKLQQMLQKWNLKQELKQ